MGHTLTEHGSDTARTFTWRGHAVRWWEHGTGQPMLLVHSIHAAASSDEWRHVVPLLAAHARVITFDLLGFGQSDRPDIEYSAALYRDLVADMLRDVVGQPAVLVGSSLGASYALAVAADHPEQCRAVVAVGPAGLERLVEPGGAPFTALQAIFRSRVPGTALFNLLVSRPSIRIFLGGIYSSRSVLTEDVLERYWRTAHRPGARFAPAAFVGQQLNCDLRQVLGRVRVPAALFWGADAFQTPIGDARRFRTVRPDFAFRQLPGGDLPHEESPDAFSGALLEFLQTLD